MPEAPPPTNARWIVPIHIVAALGSLIELPVAGTLLSRPNTVPVFIAGAAVCSVMFVVFLLALPKAAPQWSQNKRVASAMFLSFGIMGWITLILGVAFVGLLAGACFCFKR